ncbi:unnamed protein product, partial [Heterosigma akashiwo]
GFRLDPQDRLDDVFKEVTSLHQVYSVNPIFGVDFQEEEKAPNIEDVRVTRVEDDHDIITNESEESDAFAACQRTATRPRTARWSSTWTWAWPWRRCPGAAPSRPSGRWSCEAHRPPGATGR